MHWSLGTGKRWAVGTRETGKLASPKTCLHLEPERQPDQVDLEASWEGGRSEQACPRLSRLRPVPRVVNQSPAGAKVGPKVSLEA
jgi:hypothetical protein